MSKQLTGRVAACGSTGSGRERCEDVVEAATELGGGVDGEDAEIGKGSPSATVAAWRLRFPMVEILVLCDATVIVVWRTRWSRSPTLDCGCCWPSQGLRRRDSRGSRHRRPGLRPDPVIGRRRATPCGHRRCGPAAANQRARCPRRDGSSASLDCRGATDSRLRRDRIRQVDVGGPLGRSARSALLPG
jgi:hypothetical protein